MTTGSTTAVSGTSPAPSSCFQTVKESKITDAVLITGLVALLIIGILASTGVFQFMGTTNAAYLSYGMYGGATLFLIAEIVKLAINYCSKPSSIASEPRPIDKPTNDQISQIEFDSADNKNISQDGRYRCTITFATGDNIMKFVRGENAYALFGPLIVRNARLRMVQMQKHILNNTKISVHKLPLRFSRS